MGRPRKNDLRDFGYWLEERHFYVRSTTYTMASNVRRMIKEVEPMTTEGLDTFLSARSNVGPYKIAWKRFSEWVKATKDIEVPAPSAAKGRTTTDYTVPDDVCKAVENIVQAHHIPLKMLVRFRWKHVKEGRDRGRSGSPLWEVEDPTSPGTFWQVEGEWLDILREWGQPTSDLSPLVPDDPESLEPMKSTYAMKAIRAYRKRGEDSGLFD
jgi:hypothetical protein